MNCKFAERQYEYYLNKELESRAPVYIPDQRFEWYIEIDAATFSRNAKFWRLWSRWPLLNWKPGIYLSQDLWDLAEEAMKERTFPKFKCNLFLQSKRPEYISRGRRGNEYQYWKQAFLRYEIDQHQQDILYKLEEKISSHALVVYACPSFWKWNDLMIFAKGKLVENSNFAQPHKLQGHSKYTFIQSGKDGCAFSEPFRVEGMDLLRSIRRLYDKPNEFENNVEFLHGLARDIKMVVEELDEPTRQEFFMIQEISPIPEHELGKSVATILNFNLFASTTWGIAYET